MGEKKTIRRKWPAPGSFFQARQLNRNFYCNGFGYWSYPALQVSGTGRVQWVHVGLGFEFEEYRTLLFRPRAVAVTDANSTILVRYEDFKAGRDPFPQEDWTEPVSVYPHPAICEWTDEQLHSEEGKLLSVYPKAAKVFAATGELPDRFRSKYLTIAHPIFSRYLAVLAPAFSKALHS
ncbi:MAG: hypothetical protein V1873_05530 [Verrucomicrobiota bacterium]